MMAPMANSSEIVWVTLPRRLLKKVAQANALSGLFSQK